MALCNPTSSIGKADVTFRQRIKNIVGRSGLFKGELLKINDVFHSVLSNSNSKSLCGCKYIHSTTASLKKHSK
jgi:hypothetical protein